MDRRHSFAPGSGGAAGSLRGTNSCGDDISRSNRNPTSNTFSGISLASEVVHVAVGKDVKEDTLVVVWALKNNPTAKKVVLVHVHRPSPLIPVMGGKFPPNQLSEKQVKFYRHRETEKMDAILNQYVHICGSSKVQVQKLVIEMDDIAKGLLKAIEQNGIIKLVLGASNFSKRTKNPKSRTAKAVWKNAPPSCNIWIVYKGDLLSTREATKIDSMTTSSSQSTWEEESESDLEIPHEFDEEIGSIQDQLDDLRVEEDIYRHLQQAHEEAAKFRDAAHEESQKFRKAQMELLDAKLTAKHMERKYSSLTKNRKQLEEAAVRDQLEAEKLRSERDEILEKLRLAQQQQSALEEQIEEMAHASKESEAKLLESRHIISFLQRQRAELLQERDNAVRDIEDLQKIREEESFHSLPMYSEFTYAELEEATRGFDSSFKIGQGAYGCVYKAFIRHTPVAIKILNPDSLQGKAEFLQEVLILSTVRHPNLISLIGACREKFILVYDFLPNGCLEDRLTCKGNTPPLSWQARTRIITEICLALIFLHSNKPQAIVHGDLKPANILLDANLVSKLGDFGISRLLIQTNARTTLVHRTDPKGTPVYMDPEFMSSGELTTLSDVYSFGIVILRLLTGRNALGISKEVRDAIDKRNLQQALDPTAGNWPYAQAQQLAHLGLRCCEMDRRNRPDLIKDAWKILEPLKNAASFSELSSSLPSLDSPKDIPSYFKCPIFQEIMQDPQVAADGYTYEAQAMRGWLEEGNIVSPVTKSKLSHHNLIPNVALRSAIQEWMQRHQH